jgi:hypothetical protein
MPVTLAIRFFETSAGRSQPREFLEALHAGDRACIMADVLRVAEMGRAAPVSVKSITGRSGLLEIRTRGFRTFFVVGPGAAMWVLHVCRKQDQWHGIEMSVARMRKLRT